MTALQSLEQTATQIANSCSLPFEEPTVMYLQAALLLAGEERRYTELSYVDRQAEGVELTLLIVAPSRGSGSWPRPRSRRPDSRASCPR